MSFVFHKSYRFLTTWEWLNPFIIREWGLLQSFIRFIFTLLWHLNVIISDYSSIVVLLKSCLILVFSSEKTIDFHSSLSPLFSTFVPLGPSLSVYVALHRDQLMFCGISGHLFLDPGHCGDLCAFAVHWRIEDSKRFRWILEQYGIAIGSFACRKLHDLPRQLSSQAQIMWLGLLRVQCL